MPKFSPEAREPTLRDKKHLPEAQEPTLRDKKHLPEAQEPTLRDKKHLPEAREPTPRHKKHLPEARGGKTPPQVTLTALHKRPHLHLPEALQHLQHLLDLLFALGRFAAEGSRQRGRLRTRRGQKRADRRDLIGEPVGPFLFRDRRRRFLGGGGDGEFRLSGRSVLKFRGEIRPLSQIAPSPYLRDRQNFEEGG